MRTMCLIAAVLVGCVSNGSDGGSIGDSDGGVEDDAQIIRDPNGIWSMVVTENPTGCSSLVVEEYEAGTVTIADRHLEARLFSFNRSPTGEAQLCDADGTCPEGTCPGSNSVSLDIEEGSWVSGFETSTDSCGSCDASVPLPAWRFHINQNADLATFDLNVGGVTLTKL